MTSMIMGMDEDL